VDRLRSFIEALRVAQTNDPNRVVLIENAINEYLSDEPGNVRISLEWLSTPSTVKASSQARQSTARKLFSVTKASLDHRRRRMQHFCV
jgi:hypothetical protein